MTEKKFIADSILEALYHCRYKDLDFHDAAEHLFETYPKLTDYKGIPEGPRPEWISSVKAFATAQLKRLHSLTENFNSCDEWLRFAVVCRIETFSSTYYQFRESRLAHKGDSNQLPALLSLLTLAAYLSTGEAVNKTPDATGVKRDTLIRPLAAPEPPTESTQHTYRGQIAHIQKDLCQAIDDIPYLSKSASDALCGASWKTLDGLLAGADPAPAQWLSMIPLRDFTADFKEAPQRPDIGTTATFTFGILLD